MLMKTFSLLFLFNDLQKCYPSEFDFNLFCTVLCEMILVADINVLLYLWYLCRKTSAKLIPNQAWDSVQNLFSPIMLEISSEQSEVGCIKDIFTGPVKSCQVVWCGKRNLHNFSVAVNPRTWFLRVHVHNHNWQGNESQGHRSRPRVRMRLRVR